MEMALHKPERLPYCCCCKSYKILYLGENDKNICFMILNSFLLYKTAECNLSISNFLLILADQLIFMTSRLHNY